MRTTLRSVVIAGWKWGVTICPARRRGHWLAKKNGRRGFPVPGQDGGNSVLSDNYLRAFCKNFGIDEDRFESFL
jgi:hypothetical protein